MMDNSREQGFSQGIGRWLGTAEVYDGHGRFLGNATDQRHVQQQVADNQVRIDLSFVGPFKFAGHYTIEDHKTYRLYQGPANVGYAETLSSGLIDANAYWPITGLSQRFFLMVLPDGQKQLSLAIMSRGEQLMYTVIGEYHRQDGETAVGIPGFVNGTSYDLADDPAAGRGEILLHRPGKWVGSLAALDSDLNPLDATNYCEEVRSDADGLHCTVSGSAFAPACAAFSLITDQWLAWTPPGQVVGSYSLSGGRALSGHFHYPAQQLRLWRREVTSHDGTFKAVLHTWFRGGVRVGVQYGILHYAAY